jgi:hypothetical protein
MKLLPSVFYLFKFLILMTLISHWSLSSCAWEEKNQHHQGSDEIHVCHSQHSHLLPMPKIQIPTASFIVVSHIKIPFYLPIEKTIYLEGPFRPPLAS